MIGTSTRHRRFRAGGPAFDRNGDGRRSAGLARTVRSCYGRGMDRSAFRSTIGTNGAAISMTEITSITVPAGPGGSD